MLDAQSNVNIKAYFFARVAQTFALRLFPFVNSALLAQPFFLRSISMLYLFNGLAEYVIEESFKYIKIKELDW